MNETLNESSLQAELRHTSRITVINTDEVSQRAGFIY